jgi:hypothetical protein
VKTWSNPTSTHRELTDGPSDLLGFPKLGSSREINVSRVPGLLWKMHLVGDGPDDYKFRSERHTMVFQDTQVSDLVVGKFGALLKQPLTRGLHPASFYSRIAP